MKWNKDFRAWQIKFYNSKDWKEKRKHIRYNRGMVCEMCHKLIKGRSIVDHIVEITPYNKHDINIILNDDNLQLLCFNCHNKKTFGDKEIDFELREREDINLF